MRARNSPFDLHPSFEVRLSNGVSAAVRSWISDLCIGRVCEFHLFHLALMTLMIAILRTYVCSFEWDVDTECGGLSR